MADRKLVVVNGVATYVDLTPEDVAQRAIDQDSANAAAIVNAAEDARQQGLRSDADAADFVNQVHGKTAAQVKNYVQNNVTDLASAKLLLAKILLYFARTI